MFSFDFVVDAWQRRELPLLLIRTGNKLSGLFGSGGRDVAEYLELLFCAFEDEFSLGSNLFALGKILAEGGTPLLLRQLTVLEVCTPSTAIWMRPKRRQQEAQHAYHACFRSLAEGSHSPMHADFFEGILRVPMDLIEYRAVRLYTPKIGKPLADLAGRIVRAMILLECWDRLHDLNHPQTKSARDLRKMMALPLWIGGNGETTILVLPPEEQ